MRKLLRQQIQIFIGVILVAVSIEYFFAPYNIAAGGVSGIAIIVNKILPSLSISIITLILNVTLFIVAFISVGSKFGGRTILTSLLLSCILWFIEQFLNPMSVTNDILLSTIFGTLLSAVGIAIVFCNNSSTGGTDIIAKILNRLFHINIGKALLIIDFIITFFSMLVFGFDIGLYALLSVIIQGIAIDKLVDGFNYSREMLIISHKNPEISKYIINELNGRCTYIKGEKMQDDKQINILYVVLGRSDFIKLKEYIKEVDEEAFISVRECYQVLNEQ